MKTRDMSMVDYYRAQTFNPVLIPVEDERVWEDHLLKRRNLYERHLGLPLSLLEGRKVLEFGCNSGENGLVLAASGARLTFVEPNLQVLPRLKELFGRMGLEQRIEAIHEADIQSFETEKRFDLVIAEGFLSTLEDRDQMLGKILRFIKPMGFGIISFNDRCGGLLEMLKRALLVRAYTLLGIEDKQSNQALQIAQDFFLEDFQKLNASRSFETWWRDTMVVPVYTDRQLWSCPDIIPVLEAGGGFIHGTSPLWSTWEYFNWYKNTIAMSAVNDQFCQEWQRHLVYFITGFRPLLLDLHTLPPRSAMKAAEALVRDLSAMADQEPSLSALHERGRGLLEYFRGHSDKRLPVFAQELSTLFAALTGHSFEHLVATYKRSKLLRRAWGCPYHYLCFRKLPLLADEKS